MLTLSLRWLINLSLLRLAELRESRAYQANLQDNPLHIEDRPVSISLRILILNGRLILSSYSLYKLLKQNRFLFLVLDTIFKPIGQITRRHLGRGTDKQRLILLLETKFCHLPSFICLKLSDSVDKLLVFDIIDKNNRFAKYFSPTHFTNRCRQKSSSQLRMRHWKKWSGWKLHLRAPSIAGQMKRSSGVG